MFSGVVKFYDTYCGEYFYNPDNSIYVSEKFSTDDINTTDKQLLYILLESSQKVTPLTMEDWMNTAGEISVIKSTVS